MPIQAGVSVSAAAITAEEIAALIAERDARIYVLTNEVLQMKDRVHHLELRLTQDEREFCRNCSVKPVVSV